MPNGRHFGSRGTLLMSENVGQTGNRRPLKPSRLEFDEKGDSCRPGDLVWRCRRDLAEGPMSHLQSRMYAAMEEAERARQKKREAADALRARQHEYETANLRGRQKQLTRARAALEGAQAAYEAAKRNVQRLDDKAEEVIQAQVRAAYM